MADEVTQETAEETEVEETTDTAEETEAEWKAPSREEYDALQKSLAEIGDKLKKANSESASRRQKIKELEKQSETDAEKASREARESVEAELKPAMVRALAKSDLLEAGARADRVGALTKLLDFNGVEVQGGEIVGLESQVATLKTDYPEFFGQKAKEIPQAPPVPKVERGTRLPADDKPKSIGDQIAASFGFGK